MNEDQNSMNNKKIYLFWWAVFLILIVLGLWQFVFKKTPSVVTPTQNSTSATIATTTDNSNGVANQSIEGVTVVEPKPQKVSQPAPTLERSTPASTVEPAVVSNINTKMDITIANLKKNMTSFQDWIDLGFERKTLGDYTGARDDWEYVSLLYPGNLISFGDLGDLYANFLHDTARAETSYQIAIKNAPENIDYYRDLFVLFVSENKIDQGVATLQKGMSQNPTTFDLQVVLARYYRSVSNTALAKTYYDKAISIAQKQGSTTVAETLRVEENGL